MGNQEYDPEMKLLDAAAKIASARDKGEMLHLEKMVAEYEKRLQFFMPWVTVTAEKQQSFAGITVEFRTVVRTGHIVTQRNAVTEWILSDAKNLPELQERFGYMMKNWCREFLDQLLKGPPYGDSGSR